MNSNNKKRLLELLDILRSQTDMDHKLSIGDITALLIEKDISIQNRKTLYDDFKVLSDSGYDIEYDNGYYLQESPFSLSEIKIIIDSLNSLKNLDDKFLNNLKNKLYSFLSIYETKMLKKLEYHNVHSDKNFIHRLEDILVSIQRNTTVKIKRNKKDIEEITPLFLYRFNDYYYLYYHYLNSEKIYHTRFDNILSIELTDNIDETIISKNKIISNIEESTNAYISKDIEEIKFEIIDDSEYLRNRLKDDFNNVIFTKDGFSIKVSISDVFFSKLTSYTDQIKISNKDIRDRYLEFLNRIIIRNR